MIPLFAFLTSPIEWLVVGLVAMLLFGNRLPSAMRNLGRGLTEFKKGMEGSPALEDDSDKPKKIVEGDSEKPKKTNEQTDKG